MATSPSENAKTYIQMRAQREFKKRFDRACGYKGWSVQTALERVLEQWVDTIEREMGLYRASADPRPEFVQEGGAGDIKGDQPVPKREPRAR